MSTPFQNRLVGTIIVAAAIIIFLPDIFDGEKKSHQTDFEAIPQAPKFSSSGSPKTFPQDKLTVRVNNEESDEQAIDNIVSQYSSNIKNEEKKISSPTTISKNKTSSTTKNSSNTSKQKNQSETIIASGKTQTSTTKTPKAKVPKIKMTNAQEKSKNLPEKAVVAHAWVIHLGSFRHKQNVKELLAKLKKNGYVAFTKPIKTKNGRLTKVFIGPELIKSSLDKKLPKLMTLTGVKGKVARYNANK